MPTENRSSNTDMISVPRDLAEDICNGLRITQERGVKELRAILAQPAEQHQGKPVAPWYYFADCADPDYSCLYHHESEALTQVADHGGEVVKLWNVPPYADPGKVERLRASEKALAIDLAKSLKQQCADIRTIDDLRAELVAIQPSIKHWMKRTAAIQDRLAERDALLRDLDDAWNSHDGEERFGKLMQKVEALSASAEPSKSCGACGGCPNGCRLDEESPSAPVERDGLSPDEINQMAFEEGRPAEDGDGYTFTQEEFDLFVQRLLDRAALEHKPAGADDLAAFNAAFQAAMETGWDDPIDLTRQLWNAGATWSASQRSIQR
ncbi:hypothetical protein [Pseudomonas sp. I2]|uniref:hypothetical protein n=1 Tax=Pseudomonas sp. I2 TaxID=1338438 RepID=UPI0034D7419A